MQSIASVFIALVVFASAERLSYENFKVYSVSPAGREQIELLTTWQEHEGIDFWSGIRLDEASQVMANPQVQEVFETFLNENGINFSVDIADLEEKFAEERRLNNVTKRARVDEDSFNHFWELDEIYDYLDDLARRFPNIVRVHGVDRTFEDRIIKWITISLDGSAGNNPVVVMDGGIHAREWISHMTVMYLIYQLVERPENIELIRNVDWVIIPVANPDGYVYSYETDRLWRKNRAPQFNGCIGVDLNRNFDLEWRASSNPCSLTYSGMGAFSEIESRLVRNLLTRFQSKMVVYSSFHSYGNLILFPFSYHIDALIENHEENRALGEAFSDAVEAISGNTYQVGSSAQILYTSNGNSKDYAGGAHAARISYTIELPRGGNSGFDIPAYRIYEVVTETFAGIKVLAHFAADAE